MSGPDYEHLDWLDDLGITDHQADQIGGDCE